MRRIAAAALVLLAFADSPSRAEDDPVELVQGRPVVEFREDLESLERAGEVPFAPEWLDRLDGFLAAWEQRLAGELRSPASFSGDLPLPYTDGKAEHRRAIEIDRVLLREQVAHRRRGVTFERKRLDECRALAPFAAGLASLETSRRALANVTPRDAAERLDAARKAVDEIRAKVEKGIGKKPEEAGADAVVASKSAAHRTAARLDALRDVLRRWYDDRSGYEPEFAWWVRKPWEALHGALEGYAKFLREKVVGAKDDGGGPIVGDPIGDEALRAELAHEFVPYSPEEVLAIAEREFAWCEEEAKKNAAAMGLGDDWKKALAKAKANAVPVGEMDELVAAQAKEAIEFVASRDLVTVPELCRTSWSLHMIPEGQQRFTPYAYYSGDAMGVAYPSSDMDHGRKLEAMRGNNVHFSRIVTPHELIPGHHLQLWYAARHRTHRSLFRTPFLVEGWALYWEMRLWDLGWAKTPEDKAGMLFWRMHRCARIVVSLRFHLGTMTPDQMIDFLVERVGHERDGATAEVRRYVSGGYGPLYQAAYMLGGLQLRALHRELVAGGKMTERQFHDAVLRENSIPVALIRAALTGAPLGPKGPAPWRFAD